MLVHVTATCNIIIIRSRISSYSCRVRSRTQNTFLEGVHNAQISIDTMGPFDRRNQASITTTYRCQIVLRFCEMKEFIVMGLFP